MKIGLITMTVPQDSWLYPYIGYGCLYNDNDIVVDGENYPNDEYVLQGYIKDVSEDLDLIHSEQLVPKHPNTIKKVNGLIDLMNNESINFYAQGCAISDEWNIILDTLEGVKRDLHHCQNYLRKHL